MNSRKSAVLSLLLLPSTLVACSSSGSSAGGSGGASTTSATTTSAGPSDTSGTGASGGAGGTGGSGATSGTTGTTGAGGFGGGGAGSGGGDAPAAACESAGGICLLQGTCASSGGTVPASSPGGCHFDDAPAECCVPPAPAADPSSCAEAGGLCVPIGGCLDAGGYFTSIDAGCDSGPSYVCCVPHDACGAQTIDCCTDSAVYNPACDKGSFVCEIGTPVPVGTCVVP